MVNIYVFCIYLRTNSYLCHLQHKLIGFYNRDEKCLHRGTDWVFKESGLRFGFKGLILSFLRWAHQHKIQSGNIKTIWHQPPVLKDFPSLFKNNCQRIYHCIQYGWSWSDVKTADCTSVKSWVFWTKALSRQKEMWGRCT